jgi:hypothetical protein
MISCSNWAPEPTTEPIFRFWKMDVKENFPKLAFSLIGKYAIMETAEKALVGLRSRSLDFFKH